MHRNNKEKSSNAHKFYEEWMDYKVPERRASTTTTQTVSSIKSGKYKLYDEYNSKLAQTPTIASTTPPPPPVVTTPPKMKRQSLPVIQPIREKRGKSSSSRGSKPIDFDNLDDELKARIRKDFGPFYKWVRNGRTDDLKREIIEKLLFK
ncbi:unnamed protein product [Caenorhabditis bovis]|uniref:Uncharacterized protein n=1 Tax=Caenorhabditis bovis TaxID=2654633 RepID=A0A8S1EE18_9PELO|nr:unnamed protein product [Caenorhabditis bovis]